MCSSQARKIQANSDLLKSHTCVTNYYMRLNDLRGELGILIQRTQMCLDDDATAMMESIINND